MVNVWAPVPEWTDIDEKLLNLRMRQPAKLRLAPQAAAAAREEQQQARLANLPSVEEALARVRVQAQLAELRRSVFGDSAHIDDLPDFEETVRMQQAKAMPKRRAESRLRVPAGTSPKVVRQARARQLAVALVGAGDLSRPWSGLRRIGTAGYHDADR